MPAIQNVGRCNATYWFTVEVRFGDRKRFKVHISLKTKEQAVARLMGPALTAASEAIKIRMTANFNSDGLTPAERAEVFRREVIKERDRLERMHAQIQLDSPNDADAVIVDLLDAAEAVNRDLSLAGKPANFWTIDRFIARFGDRAAAVKEIIAGQFWEYPNFPVEGADAAKEHLEAMGVPGTPLAIQMAQRVVHDAKVVANRDYRHRLADPAIAYPTVAADAVFAANQNTPAVYTSTVAVTAGTGLPILPVALRPWSTMTARDAANRYLDSHPKTGGADGEASAGGLTWDAKTRRQFLAAGEALTEMMDGAPLAQVTDEHLLDLNKIFNKLHPGSYGKSSALQHLTMREWAAHFAALVAAKKLESSSLGLSITTRNRYWQFLKQLLDWFDRKITISELDWKALRQRDDRPEHEKRDAYSIEEARAVFQLTPWTGCKSFARRTVPGTLVVHDAGYWALLICWYTGLRREEVCGVRLDEIRCEYGVWFFELRVTDTRRLKNRGSARAVPFASELVRLGLPSYAEALRAAGHTHLFPELERSGGAQKRGDTFYKVWWTKLKPQLPFLKAGQAVHSFRHSTTTELGRAGVSLEDRAALAGHKIGVQTFDTYTKAQLIAQKQGTVDKIPIVTDHLQTFPTKLLPPALLAPRPAPRAWEGEMMKTVADVVAALIAGLPYSGIEAGGWVPGRDLTASREYVHYWAYGAAMRMANATKKR